MWLRYGVPATAALAVVAASVLLTRQSIAERAGVKRDWEEVALGDSGQVLEAYDIDITTVDMGQDWLRQAYPQGAPLDIVVPPNRLCAVSGRFGLPDWATSIEIERGTELHVSPHATADEIGGTGYARSETEIYTLDPSETAWSWASKDGKNVEFQRPLPQKSIPTLLGIKLFSESEGRKVTGSVELACAAER